MGSGNVTYLFTCAAIFILASIAVTDITIQQSGYSRAFCKHETCITLLYIVNADGRLMRHGRSAQRQEPGTTFLCGPPAVAVYVFFYRTLLIQYF